RRTQTRGATNLLLCLDHRFHAIQSFLAVFGRGQAQILAISDSAALTRSDPNSSTTYVCPPPLTQQTADSSPVPYTTLPSRRTAIGRISVSHRFADG